MIDAQERNKQRKILTTITYNDLEIILDVKVEELDSSADLQPTCNQLATDCISRHGAIDMIMGQPPEAHYPSWYAEQIKALPPAHPEIIRCRNCKYYMLGSDDVRYCFNHDDDILWQDDDFCSRAERREGERNDI